MLWSSTKHSLNCHLPSQVQKKSASFSPWRFFVPLSENVIFLWNYIWVSHKNFCYETYYRRGHITKNQGEVTKAVQSSFLYEMYLSLYQSLDFCFGWLSNKSSLWCSIRENCRRLSEQVQRNWLGSFLPRSLVVPLSDNIPIPFSWRMRGIKTLSSKSHAASSASMYGGLEWRKKTDEWL